MTSFPRRGWRQPFALLAVLLMVLAMAPPGHAYSILTHEQLIELVWISDLQPLLLRRYPGLTPAELRDAHAFAYGGAIVDDVGYYPYGNHLFSDLAHYARSGDLVAAMLDQSRDANEFAFALGMLAHYTADCFGHPAVNESVGLEFPALQRRFGHVVTYEDNPAAHMRVEFSFDILQIAKYRYPTQAYGDFVGFKISVPLLTRVYASVYGLPLERVLPDPELAIGSFRYAVGTVLPKLDAAALQSYRKQFFQQDPAFNPDAYRYGLKRAQFERQWGRKYRHPSLLARLLAECIVHLPKVGPLRGLEFRRPTAAAETLYLKSIDITIAQFRESLAAEGYHALRLPNRNLDTGADTRRGDYRLADQTYFQLTAALAADGFTAVSPGLRDDILAFYAMPAVDGLSRRDSARLQGWLRRLQAMPAAAAGSNGTIDSDAYSVAGPA
ncbi:MAG TPA: zinc dependent phospholipase C family protein [Terriglobales bacterium]|nr:zinc dependent phospholipase C family protein [Terriglobales bacterium]